MASVREEPSGRRGDVPPAPRSEVLETDTGYERCAADPERTRDTLLRITARRAEVLRELADGYTGREAATRIGLTHSGMRSHVEALKEITGSSSARELGRWWRRNRIAWLGVMSVQAGMTGISGDAEPVNHPDDPTT